MIDYLNGYAGRVRECLARLPFPELARIVDLLAAKIREGKQIIVFGNGGSAATASHMMNDLNKYCSVPGRPRFRAIALTDNMPLLTAVGNDNDYSEVFVEPLKSLLQAGDTLIAISASGNSPNVVRAVDYAHAHGAQVIGFCGQPGGKLAQTADLRVIIPSGRIGQQEDGHLILNHALAFALRARLEQEPAP